MEDRFSTHPKIKEYTKSRLSVHSGGEGEPVGDSCALTVRKLNQYSCVQLTSQETSVATDPAKLREADVRTLSPDIVLVSHESMDHLDLRIIEFWASHAPLRVFASAGAWVALKRQALPGVELSMAVSGETAEARGWRFSFGRSVHGYYLEPVISVIETPTRLKVLHAFDSDAHPVDAGHIDIGIFPAGIAPGTTPDTLATWVDHVSPRFALSSHHLEDAVRDLQAMAFDGTQTIAIPWNGWIRFDETVAGERHPVPVLTDPEAPRELMSELRAVCEGRPGTGQAVPGTKRGQMVSWAIRAQKTLAGRRSLSGVLDEVQAAAESDDGAIADAAIECLGWGALRDEQSATVALEWLCAEIGSNQGKSGMMVRRKMALEVLRIVREIPGLAGSTRKAMLLCCEDENPDVRGIALMVLPHIHDAHRDPEWVSEVIRLLGDDDPDVRCSALLAAKSMLDQTPVEVAARKAASGGLDAPPPLCDVCSELLHYLKIGL